MIPEVYKHTEKMYKSVVEAYDMFRKPPTTKFLPDMVLPPGMPAPKTLVLNFTGTIVHAEYDVGKGYKYKKRPGLDKFLNKLKNYYEIVVYGEEDTYTLMEVCEQI